jgi:hypothetical protein
MAGNIRPFLSSTEYLSHGPKGLKIVKRKTQWTQRRKAKFLKELERSCNVSRAEKAAGCTAKTSYAERRADSDFAAAWDAAMEQGYLVLEQQLMALALREVAPENAAEAAESQPIESPPKINPDLALRMLAAHQAKMAKIGRTGPIRTMSREEAEAEILEQLLALKKRNDARRAQGR